jgi:hypothetical protein
LQEFEDQHTELKKLEIDTKIRILRHRDEFLKSISLSESKVS